MSGWTTCRPWPELTLQAPELLLVACGVSAQACADLQHSLCQHGMVFSQCTADHALAQIQATWPDLILLYMAEQDDAGYTLSQQLAADPLLAVTPVVFYAATSDPEAALRALHSGAVDFMRSACGPAELCARLAVHLTLRRARQQLELRNLWLQMELLACSRA